MYALMQRLGTSTACRSLQLVRSAPSPSSPSSFSLTRLFASFSFRSTVVSEVAMSSQALVSSRHSHNGATLQFPPLPPQLVEHYRPGQMLQHEDSLPKLPVPPLQQTLRKYLSAVEPLMSAAELERTKEVVADFARPGGEGEKLQTKLLERASKTDNWLSDWWQNVAYLGFRSPVLVHSNPATTYPRQPCGDTDTYLRTAASHLLFSIKWSLLTAFEAVPPDIYRKQPLSMSQFKVHSTCRVPALGSDILRKTPIEQSRHVIVARKGHFYRLDVLYETAAGDLAVAPSSHILGQLRAILDRTSEPASYPVGLLTAEHRDTWYHARERLRRDSVNQASLEAIETSQLVLYLDSAHPLTASLPHDAPFTEDQSTVAVGRNLHGNGTCHNSANRWFDHTIQFIVSEDGICGNNLEHSAADGPPAIAGTVVALDVFSRLKYDVLAEVSPVEPAHLRPAELLHWNISPETAQDIDTARINVDKLVANTDIQAFIFTDFGKGLPKSAQLSPDGFFQIAIQLAYFKLYGKLTGMYESGSTRRFKAGRTDTIRSVSAASLKFVQAMSDPSASAEERLRFLQAAVQRHTEYTNDASAGQAIDRHLLGLMLLSREAGMEQPAIFQDPAFQRSMYFCLSTSQVPVGGHRIFLGFGAVVEDGYGVCYNPLESSFLITVSSFRSCLHTDSQLFGGKLKEALREMREVVVAAKSVHSNI